MSKILFQVSFVSKRPHVKLPKIPVLMRIPNPGHVKRGRELPRGVREINIIIHYLSLSKQ